MLEPMNERLHITTGEASRICGVSQQTIIRWFDERRLQGYIIPGSSHRRILKESLYEFMKANGIKAKEPEKGSPSV